MIDVRKQMTNRYNGHFTLDPAEVIGIAIHHSVSGGLFYDTLPDTIEDEIAHLLAIDRYHIRQGYDGFGYHLAAFPSGRYYLCGSITVARAHVASLNNKLIGVVLIGDFTAVPPPAGSIEAARQAVAFIRETYPNLPIAGHRDWALPEYPTGCPGATWQAWLGSIDFPLAEEDDMKLLIVKGDQSPDQFCIGSDGRKTRLGSLEHRAALEAAGAIPPNEFVTILQARMDAIPDASGAP